MQSTTCPATTPRSPVAVIDWIRLALKADLTDAEKNCAVALATFVNSRSGLAWPSMATLGAAAGLSEQTARRAVHRLSALGLITILERAGRSNHFLLCLGAPIAADTPPLTAPGPEQAKVTSEPPPAPQGGAETDRRRAARSAARQAPRHRSRRPAEPEVYAGCHAPAPAEYLQPQPRAQRPIGAIEALHAAVSRGRIDQIQEAS